MQECSMRACDIIFALLALLFLSPLLLTVVVILTVTGEGEVFYRQKRVGKDGKYFNILKFATMLKDSPNMGSGSITSKNDTRILPVGRILRKTKINELPQLINILAGEMSLIGPRPHVERDLEGVSQEKFLLLQSIKPGLSGIASIIFRDEEVILQKFEDPRIIYDEVIAPYKAELEIWYVANYSLLNYFKLIGLTFFSLFVKRPNLIYASFKGLPLPSSKLCNLQDLSS